MIGLQPVFDMSLLGQSNHSAAVHKLSLLQFKTKEKTIYWTKKALSGHGHRKKVNRLYLSAGVPSLHILQLHLTHSDL